MQVERFDPDIKVGLTEKQVKARKKENLVNYDTSVPTKTVGQIISSNIFTLFNILNFILALFIVLVKSYKNLLFLGVVFCNTIISIVQELRAKKEIDSLSIIASSKVNAIRNGKQVEIAIDEIVLDDILKLDSGDQVITDGVIKSGSCEVDESFITGESDTITKKQGDFLRSGSFIVSGSIVMRVEHVGLDNYTAKISHDAKYKKPSSSILMHSLNTIIKWISITIIPIGFILFWNQQSIPGNTIENAIVSTVAALVGMIPEGLILLTSTVLAVSVIRLSKYNVLVKDLYCIESLARIDTLCLDKTGTITEGKMEVTHIIPYREINRIKLEQALNAFAHGAVDNNGTIKAIQHYYSKPVVWKVKDILPFSSALKYSAISFQKEGTYYLGAPDILLKKEYESVKPLFEKDLLEHRILVFIHTHDPLAKETPKQYEILGFVYLQDKIRKDAKKTLAFFKKQGVQIKLISGDNVKTVAGIAKRAGVDHYQDYIDASLITTHEELLQASQKYTIFGRVTPVQKRELIQCLKENGHFVAMMGDGVNDVLALKEAHCSIAMPNGSDAAKNISEMILLHSNFDAMPKIVAEGRRTVNNIEQSATLFLTKTSYSTILAILFIFLNMHYPFMPIQLTLTSIVTIGIPSFVLALQPNKDRIRGNFFKNVLSKSLPTAILVVLNIIIIMAFAHFFHFSSQVTSTLCVMMTAITGFMLLYYLCEPFNLLKQCLFLSMVVLFFLQTIFLKKLYSLVRVNLSMLVLLIALTFMTVLLFQLFSRYFYRKIKPKKMPI